MMNNGCGQSMYIHIPCLNDLRPGRQKKTPSCSSFADARTVKLDSFHPPTVIYFTSFII